jgi:hypothetical protein
MQRCGQLVPEMEDEFRCLCKGVEGVHGAIVCMQANDGHTVGALQCAMQSYGDRLQTKLYPLQIDDMRANIAFDKLKRRILQVRESFLSLMPICCLQPNVQSMMWSLRCTQARYAMQIKELQVHNREICRGEDLAPCAQSPRLQMSMKSSILGLCEFKVEDDVSQTIRGADKEYLKTHRKLRDMPQIQLLQNFVWSACDKMQLFSEMQERVESIESNRERPKQDSKRPATSSALDQDEDYSEEQPLQS